MSIYREWIIVNQKNKIWLTIKRIDGYTAGGKERETAESGKRRLLSSAITEN